MDEVILCTKEGRIFSSDQSEIPDDALRVIDDEEVDLYFMNAKARASSRTRHRAISI